MQQTKRAVLFVNGELASTNWLNEFLKEDDFLVAVDGGWRYLKPLGRFPNLLIGDFDSLDNDDLQIIQASGCEIARFPTEKNETDLELAFAAVLQRGYTAIRVIAALGGRLDQTLGNLFLLTRPEYAICDIRLEDGQEEVFLVQQESTIHGRPGETLSLIPLGIPAKQVTTEALKYPLKGETLYPDQTRGISNVMLSQQAKVSHAEGTLLCIHRRKVD